MVKGFKKCCQGPKWNRKQLFTIGKQYVEVAGGVRINIKDRWDESERNFVGIAKNK